MYSFTAVEYSSTDNFLGSFGRLAIGGLNLIEAICEEDLNHVQYWTIIIGPYQLAIFSGCTVFINHVRGDC